MNKNAVKYRCFDKPVYFKLFFYQPSSGSAHGHSKAAMAPLRVAHPDDEQEKGQRVKNAEEETNALVCYHGS